MIRRRDEPPASRKSQIGDGRRPWPRCAACPWNLKALAVLLRDCTVEEVLAHQIDAQEGSEPRRRPGRKYSQNGGEASHREGPFLAENVVDRGRCTVSPPPRGEGERYAVIAGQSNPHVNHRPISAWREGTFQTDVFVELLNGDAIQAVGCLEVSGTDPGPRGDSPEAPRSRVSIRVVRRAARVPPRSPA